MRRGLDEQKLSIAIAYIHGRIEHEIETFASSLSIPAVELTQRLGALLQGSGQWAEDRMPDLQGRRRGLATGQRSIPASALEDALQPHGNRTLRLTAPSEGSSQADPHEVKPHPLKGRKQAWWSKLSRKEKDAIIAKRKASRDKKAA